MNNQTYDQIINKLKSIDIYLLIANYFGEDWSKMTCDENGEAEDIKYAIMFNVETFEIFPLHYATIDNNWNEIAESQNPWITIGFVSALDCVEDNAKNSILSYVAELNKNYLLYNNLNS